MRRTPQPAGILRATAYLGAVFVAVPAAIGLLGSVLLPDSNPDGRCDGLGFGCTLPPNDTAALISIFVLFGTVPAVASSPVVMALWARWSPSFRDRSARAKAVLVTALYAVGGVGALVFVTLSNRAG